MTWKLENHAIEKMDEYGVPEHMQGGLVRYFNDRIDPGHFLTAVLENNLMKAFDRADLGNRKALYSYVVWLYNQAPMGSYGSPEKVKAWLEGEGEA
jgi:hypothetical protein